jgi:hypothetical protein
MFLKFTDIFYASRFCVLSVSIVHAVSTVFTAVGFPIFSVSPGVRAIAGIPAITGACYNWRLLFIAPLLVLESLLLHF